MRPRFSGLGPGLRVNTAVVILRMGCDVILWANSALPPCCGVQPVIAQGEFLGGAPMVHRVERVPLRPSPYRSGPYRPVLHHSTIQRIPPPPRPVRAAW